MSDQLDRRGVRIDQAFVAALLGAAFVFSVWRIVPIVWLVPACGALWGPRASAGQWVIGQARRGRGPDHPPLPRHPVREPSTLRTGLVVETLGLVVAIAGFLAGTDPLAWLVVLAVALVAVIGASFGGWPLSSTASPGPPEGQSE